MFDARGLFNTLTRRWLNLSLRIKGHGHSCTAVGLSAGLAHTH